LQESEFLEFTFLVFPCLATTWKTSQRKLNSGQHRKHNINKGKCFSFEKNRKTLSFSFITHIFLTCSNHGLSLFVNNWDAATSASFPFFLTHILQNRQNQINYKSKQNPYPEDYYESIKAKWPNFPSKKHSLPGFPVPG
jgi:hypothetical protein